ncbi:SOM1 protein [Xylariales sp. AK1849]|nr:SOM1 protein [Xylariales sp. AK1849]
MNNISMANMNAMGGPVGGGHMPMGMNNGAMAQAVQQMPPQQQQQFRTILNTYIYDYLLKEGLYDTARSFLSTDQPLNVHKDSPGRRRDENGNLLNGVGDDPMDTDSKDEFEKRPSDLPSPNVPQGSGSESGFLYEWFCLFWDMLHAQRNKPGGNPQVGQYINHTQQQNRLKQSQQQEMLRQMRPDQGMQFNPAMMRNMPNGMQLAANKNNLARTAMANNQNNPQQAMAMMQQQVKQNQIQRDPSDMDGNRRPASPSSADNAPSPSKRQRLEGNTPFNQQQGGAMMSNGRPQPQGMPGQQMANAPNNAAAQAATQLLVANGINPQTLSAQQFQNFQTQPPQAQQKSIQTYSQTLQQHHGQQMPNKGMANPGNPQGQGSPMMPQGPNGADLNNFYNANELAGPGGMRPGGPGNGQGGSNHALQDYQMQLMLLEQQNKKRLMMARQEQDSMGGMAPRGDGPGGPPGPNGQPFPDTSPQGSRPGASPNPSEQMKRSTPQMNPAGIPSPLPEGAQSRGSPNPMNFMPGSNMDPQHFFNNGQMNGAMRPPSSHPNQPFNGQMNQQMMAAQRQAQGVQGGPQMQWQGGPNGANPIVPQGPQGQVQGTPQQRAMPPPSAPAPGGAPNGRTQPSPPAQSNAAPPTPQQANKPAPKKNNAKNAKGKAAAQKKSNANTGATPVAEASQEPEPPTPATPITPINPQSFSKNGQNAAGAQPVPNAQTSAPPAPASVAPQAQPDPSAGYGIGNSGMVSLAMRISFDSANPEKVEYNDQTLIFADPITSDNVLQDFDFDSFLHDGDGGDGGFDFNPSFDMQGTGEIVTE